MNLLICSSFEQAGGNTLYAEDAEKKRGTLNHNLFETLREFDAGNGRKGEIYSLPDLELAGIGRISRLPISIRLLRHLRDSRKVKIMQGFMKERNREIREAAKNTYR